MTEEQKNNRIYELVRELRELAGARAVVWWTAEDVLLFTNDEAYGEGHGKVTQEQAQGWLDDNEDDINEWMTSRGWDYITMFAPQVKEEAQ
jgi:hypothetical protein